MFHFGGERASRIAQIDPQLMSVLLSHVVHTGVPPLRAKRSSRFSVFATGGIMNTRMRTCAYCMKEKAFHRKGVKFGSKFNVEHVIQRALASVRNNLTIEGSVCTDCNFAFSKLHDLWITRSGVEGVLRYVFKQKSLSMLHELETTNVSLVPIQPPVVCEPFQARHKFIDEAGSLGAENQPGVHYTIAGGATGFIPVSKIESTEFLDLFGTENTEIYIHESPDPSVGYSIDDIACMLEKKGVSLTHGEQFQPKPAVCRVTHKVDLERVRAYCKIAFNYFVYLCELWESTEFLRPSFDPIRDFIRKGEGDPNTFFQQSGFHVMSNDRSPRGHILRLTSPRASGFGYALRVDGTLFNETGWTVILANNLSKQFINDAEMHFWDIKEKVCTVATATNPLAAAARLDREERYGSSVSVSERPKIKEQLNGF